MNLIDYIKGKRKGKSAQKIELEAMYDPFLSEAIEGYDSVKGDHTKAITNLQGKISKKSKKISLWVIFSSVSSVAAILILLIIFTVKDKNNQAIYASEYTMDSENVLFVYIPEKYVQQVQMSELSVSPIVEIDNAELLTPLPEINVFVSEKYIIRKKTNSSNEEIETTTVIINLKEILTPDTPIDLYVPEEYFEKRKNHLNNDGIILQNDTF